MPIGFGQVAASDINAEFGRGGQMGIWEARNGYYGGINDASGYRPTANGQSGYAYSEWRGYFGGASRPYVYIFKYEANGSCSIRLYKYNVYGGADWSEAPLKTRLLGCIVFMLMLSISHPPFLGESIVYPNHLKSKVLAEEG